MAYFELDQTPDYIQPYCQLSSTAGEQQIVPYCCHDERA